VIYVQTNHCSLQAYDDIAIAPPAVRVVTTLIGSTRDASGADFNLAPSI
jgi:hypothetical protein